MDLAKMLSELKRELEEERIDSIKQNKTLSNYYKAWYDCTPKELSEIKDKATRENYIYLYRDFFSNVLLPLYQNVIANYPDFVIDNAPNRQTIKSMLYQLTRYCDKDQIKDIMAKK